MQHQSAYLKFLSAMIAKIAKADGRIDASEIRSAENSFVRLGFSEVQRQLCILALKEKVVLEHLEQSLKLGHGTFDRLFRQRVQQKDEKVDQYWESLDDECAEIGCTRIATDDEIRNAYRNLVKRLHPDVLKAQGIPDALMRNANERMARINAAWDKIKRARGIKN